MDGQSSDPRAPALDPNLNDVDVDVDADANDVDDTESVISDLSTDEFAKDLETDFGDAMNHIKTTKPFFSLHTLLDYPGGVSVPRVGSITMPLEEEQAEQILCYDDDPEVDGENDGCSFRSLSPDEFDLDDSIWPSIIQGCLDRATRDLGITTPLVADPWALILMKSGQTYGELELASPFDDVGNLVIFLPSRHEGGEIVVKRRKTEKVVFAPDQAAQSFTTLSSKINSLQIQSGYLWALLCSVETIPYLELRPLRHTLRRWMAKDCASRSLNGIYYQLQGNYLKMKMSRRQLKGDDLYRVQHLQDLSDRLPFEIFLAFIRRVNSDTFLDREIDQSKKYETRIFSLDGNLITEMITDDRGSAHRFDSPHVAVLIVPRDAVASYFHDSNGISLYPSSNSLQPLLRHYARACLEDTPPLKSFMVFKQIFSFMMTAQSENTEGHWTKLAMEGSDLLNVLEAFLVIQSYSWFTHFGLKFAVELPESIFSRFRKWLPIAHGRDRKVLKAIEEVLSKVIFAYSRPAQQIKAVKKIINLEQERSQNGRPRSRLIGIPDFILSFVRQVLQACIETCGTKWLTAQDGQALTGFSLYFDNPFAILSLIKDKIGLEHQPAAILGIIHKVNHYGKHGYLPEEESLKFSRDMARSLIASTAFERWRGVTDGYYFRKYKGNNDINNINHYYDSDSDLGEYGEYDDFERHQDDWDFDKYEKFIEQEEQHDNMYDEYDDYENIYADSYRTCLYIDEDASQTPGRNRPGKSRPDMNQYQDQFGRAQSSTFLASGIEENGVHYRSFFCFFEQIVAPVEQPDEVLKLLVTKVVEAAPHISHTEFDTLWMPLVKEFIPLVNCLGGLIGHSRELLMSGFLSAILKAYVSTWVGQYPKRPSLIRSGVHCLCPDCKGLNVFLANPLLRAGRFKANRTRVQHILDEMARASVDFKSDMVVDADSITLVVIKTERLLEQARRQWANRRYHASKEVAKIGLTGLEFIFGTGWMSFLSMAHLGGVGFDNLGIRTLLKMKTGLSTDVIKARSATMFFRCLPRPTTACRVSRPTRKKKWWEVESPDVFPNSS